MCRTGLEVCPDFECNSAPGTGTTALVANASYKGSGDVMGINMTKLQIYSLFRVIHRICKYVGGKNGMQYHHSIV